MIQSTRVTCRDRYGNREHETMHSFWETDEISRHNSKSATAGYVHDTNFPHENTRQKKLMKL